MVVVGCGSTEPRTVSSARRVPPASSTSSSATRCAAAYAAAGSTPRSNRRDASVESLWRRDVRARVIASKCAASITTSRVPADSSLVAPPITPARPIGPVWSVITRSSTSSGRTTSSRVVSFSPSYAWRTTIGPSSVSRS